MKHWLSSEAGLVLFIWWQSYLQALRTSGIWDEILTFKNAQKKRGRTRSSSSSGGGAVVVVALVMAGGGGSPETTEAWEHRAKPKKTRNRKHFPQTDHIWFALSNCKSSKKQTQWRFETTKKQEKNKKHHRTTKKTTLPPAAAKDTRVVEWLSEKSSAEGGEGEIWGLDRSGGLKLNAFVWLKKRRKQGSFVVFCTQTP